MIPFLLLYIVLFAYLSWRNFQLALQFVIFALPAYLIRFDLAGVPSTLLEVMIWILFLTYLVRIVTTYRIKGLKQWIQRPSHEFLNIRLAMFLLLIAATVAVFVSPDRFAAAGIWKAYFLEAMLFFIVFVSSVRSRQELFGAFYALGLSVLAIFVFGVYQKFTGWKLDPIYLVDGKVDRITSVYGFPNAIGLYVAPIVALYIGWISETWTAFRQTISRKRNIILAGIFQLLVIASGITSILFAKSEGAIVGLLASMIFIGVILPKWRKRTLIIGLISLGFIFMISPARDAILSKLTFQGWSEQVRLTMWNETWELIKDHPLTGVGLSGYPIAFVPYHQASYIEIFQYPHNILFNVWVELGLLGVFSFIWIVYAYLRLCLSSLRREPAIVAGLLGAMTVILVHGLVDVPYFKNDLSVLFWIFVGASMIFYRQTLTRNKQKV